MQYVLSRAIHPLYSYHLNPIMLKILIITHIFTLTIWKGSYSNKVVIYALSNVCKMCQLFGIVALWKDKILMKRQHFFHYNWALSERSAENIKKSGSKAQISNLRLTSQDGLL